MKRRTLIIGLLISIFACKRENDFVFPLIQTGEVTDIDSSGAVFHARITDLSKTGILEYGFIWGPISVMGTDPYRISLSEKAENGTCSVKISTDLCADTGYYVKAFARNDNYTTYGKVVSFKSLGSLSPVILGFSPKEGTNDTKVTITGRNFSSYLNGNIVRFGNAIPEIIEATNESIVVLLPSDLHVSGRVNITVETSKKNATSISKFLLFGCDIMNFIPESLRIGDTLFVIANNPGTAIQDNLLQIGGAVADIISVNNNIIVTFVPYNPELGYKEVKLTVAGKTCFSDKSVFLENPWSKIDGNIPFNRHYGSNGFSIGNKIYAGFGMNFGGPFRDLYEFNFQTDIWKNCSDLPGPEREYPIAFSIGDEGYVGLGTANSIGNLNDLYLYDPISDMWTRKSDFPGTKRASPFGMAIGNKAYAGIGIGIYENYRDFWEYNPENDTWTKLGDYPGDTFSNLASFTYNGKGYILECESRNFWEYTPSIDFWKKLVDFPGDERYGAVSFRAGKYGYVGMGVRPDFVVLKDFWRFDIDNNVWRRIADIPYRGRVGALGFTIDNKGIICSGSYNSGAWNDENFIVFNPK